MNVENSERLDRVTEGGTAAIEQLESELERLLAEIKSKERWERRQEVREDVDGDEVVTKFVLVGAEKLRQRYESLLATKQMLVGVV
jgi:hypothetical protein